LQYNLVRDRWLPVLLQDGNVERFTLLEALEKAHLVRGIALSNPMDRFSIFRFLLAVLYWCKGKPDESNDQHKNGMLPNHWFRKVADRPDFFEVYDNDRRFYQTPPLPDDKKKTVNYLIHENPTGTNPWHFRHILDDRDGLCPACCVYGLLRLPAFTTAGGRGFETGLHKQLPFYVVPLGDSLAETLLLSWRGGDFELGAPVWECAEVNNGPEHIPLLQGLTWTPRRVWLEIPSGKGICSLCGLESELTRKCVFENKPMSGNRSWSDPHVIQSSDKKDDYFRPKIGFGKRAMWQFLSQWVAFISSKNIPSSKKIWIVGLVADKAACKHVFEYVLTIPPEVSTLLEEAKVSIGNDKLRGELKQFFKSNLKNEPLVEALFSHHAANLECCYRQIVSADLPISEAAIRPRHLSKTIITQILSSDNRKEFCIFQERHRLMESYGIKFFDR